MCNKENARYETFPELYAKVGVNSGTRVRLSHALIYWGGGWPGDQGTFAMRLAGSQFPNQGLNLGPGSENDET